MEERPSEPVVDMGAGETDALTTNDHEVTEDEKRYTHEGPL